MSRTNLLSSAYSKSTDRNRDLSLPPPATLGQTIYCILKVVLSSIQDACHMNLGVFPGLFARQLKFIHLGQDTFFTYLSGNRPVTKRCLCPILQIKHECYSVITQRRVIKINTFFNHLVAFSQSEFAFAEVFVVIFRTFPRRP